MARYRRMTDAGSDGHLIVALAICGNEDEPPRYEYKDDISDVHNLWDWEKYEHGYWHKYSHGCYSEKAFRDPSATMDFPEDRAWLRDRWFNKSSLNKSSHDPLNDPLIVSVAIAFGVLGGLLSLSVAVYFLCTVFSRM